MVALHDAPETLVNKSGKFIPSRYQQAIFDAIERGENHIQVQAVAGSGKTTTLVQALNRLPLHLLRSTLVCAFNKEIANELGTRVPQGVVVKTIHSVGLATIMQAMKQANCAWSPDKINGNKYRNMVRSWWEEKSGGAMQDEVFTAIIDLIHFARVTLADYKDSEALSALLDEHEIDCPATYREFICREWVPMFLEWGAFGRSREEGGRVIDPFRPTWGPEEVIDFDDMLWLPHVRKWQPKRFDRVMVDECQDLSRAQLELVLRCLKDGGLVIAVGDPKQAIYGFTGADVRSYQNIAERTRAEQLPLSVCYRCPRTVVEAAKALVPDIECGPDATVGVVETIKAESFEELVQPGDMVLCRVNAPLISKAFELLAAGKRARVRGRDIGAQMIKLIDTIAKRPGFSFASFQESVEAWRVAEIASLDSRKDNTMRIESIQDRADSICALYGAALARGARSVPDLRAEVQALFVDDGQGYIILSSIHRAKGLEADRVFILKPNLLPHPMAKGERQIEQEWNLRYVAITRAKRELYFVEDRPR
jgi:DNA helicase-2/ATP-dependent DNA helicase PcrA